MNRNILIISTEYPPGPGGIGQHAYSLSKALHNLGYTIKVITTADYASPDEVSQFDKRQNFEVERYTRQGGLLTYVSRLKSSCKAILGAKYLSVILTGKFSLWQGLMVKTLNPNIKTLAILHGTEINLPNAFLRWLTHKAIAKADIIIPVSAFTKSLLPEWITRKHPKIYIIPNGIDDEQQILNVNTDITLFGSPRLLTVGHVSPRKGQHRVIKALPKLIEAWPNLHYHIIGRPQNKTALEILAQQLGVRDHITFHGRVADHQTLGSYYTQSDVFMLLSENQPDGDVEGFGIVALEANVHGVPVVGAKFCGVEEAVNHLKSGYLVNGDNPNEILEGVKYCIENKEKIKSGAKAWAHAHVWSSIVLDYNKLLN